mmetsp:Transcript_60941/g.170454  ORF Transcript_60941/g.170454 Transcript_60941/m.170454 type:complete len:226 (-) Transcript_60941:255-932(-)
MRRLKNLFPRWDPFRSSRCPSTSPSSSPALRLTPSQMLPHLPRAALRLWRRRAPPISATARGLRSHPFGGVSRASGSRWYRLARGSERELTCVTRLAAPCQNRVRRLFPRKQSQTRPRFQRHPPLLGRRIPPPTWWKRMPLSAVRSPLPWAQATRRLAPPPSGLSARHCRRPRRKTGGGAWRRGTTPWRPRKHLRNTMLSQRAGHLATYRRACRCHRRRSPQTGV